MSKVGGALPAWYWPAGVPRRVPVAQRSLGGILRRQFGTASTRPALVSTRGVVSYGELLAQALAIAGGIQASDTTGTLALVESDPIEAVTLLLGSLFAGHPVLVTDTNVSEQRLAAQVEEAEASALIAATDLPQSGKDLNVPKILRNDLKGEFRQAGSVQRGSAPAILLASGRGVVVHSHFSMLAMPASLIAFISDLSHVPYLCVAPEIASWEALTGILGAFISGTPVIFTTVAELNAGREPPVEGRSYVILSRSEAETILREGHVPKLIRESSPSFISTGYFKPHWRRRLEALWGRPIFPIWGVPELGPVVASHPTWLPFHGHGLPLVNVSLYPIDPASGQISVVPWEMLEDAEIGVEALSAMLGYADRKRNAGVKIGKITRTRQIASMDHVGVVILNPSNGHA